MTDFAVCPAQPGTFVLDEDTGELHPLICWRVFETYVEAVLQSDTYRADTVQIIWPGAKPLATRPAAEVHLSDLDIKYGKRTFLKQSFWRFREAAVDLLMVFEAGAALPDDTRVQRINRDDYFSLRKTLPVMQGGLISNKTEAPDTDGDDLI